MDPILSRSRWLVGLCLVFAAPAWGATTVTVGTDPAKTVIQGTLVTPDQVMEGEVVIDGDTITCVAPECVDPPGATVIRVTDAYVFPGFIDAHNHVAYNVFPKWSPPQQYQNRGQWQGSTAYKTFKAPYNQLKATLLCEMVKWGEIKALLSGVTTIQGTAPNRACFRILIRNAENQNELGLNPKHIRTFILDIKGFKEQIDWAVTKTFVVHIGEGIDLKSRTEFATLKQKGLLTGQTAIIHGTAFEAPDFQEMAAAGAKLIWSPRSNLVLYGQTTKVNVARQQGVEVSLGVDWNPTGSDTLFDELRVAAQVNDEQFGGAIPVADWVQMVTTHPAKALALEDHIGRLAVGLKADLTVVAAKAPDPRASLLQSHLQDVLMVWVGGNPLYGAQAVLGQVKPGQCEALLVYGSAKRLCVRNPRAGVAKSGQSLAEIQHALQSKYPGLAPLTP